MHRCAAASIGHVAHRAVSAGGSGHLVGNTSKGLFVRSPGRWILFISYGSHSGPLTIALGSPVQRLGNARQSAGVLLSDGGLTLPDVQLEIAIAGDSVWRPQLSSGCSRSASRRLQPLTRVAEAALSGGSGPGYSGALATLLDLPYASAETGNCSVSPPVRGLQAALRRDDLMAAAAWLERLLGEGRGLTPSGDDLAMGLLLALERRRRLAEGLGGSRRSLTAW